YQQYLDHNYEIESKVHRNLTLELRIELVKNAGNLILEYLKRFDHLTPVVENYVKGKLAIHHHGSDDGGKKFAFVIRGPRRTTVRVLCLSGLDRALSLFVQLQPLYGCSRSIAVWYRVLSGIWARSASNRLWCLQSVTACLAGHFQNPRSRVHTRGNPVPL